MKTESSTGRSDVQNKQELLRYDLVVNIPLPGSGGELRLHRNMFYRIKILIDKACCKEMVRIINDTQCTHKFSSSQILREYIWSHLAKQVSSSTYYVLETHVHGNKQPKAQFSLSLYYSRGGKKKSMYIIL